MAKPRSSRGRHDDEIHLSSFRCLDNLAIWRPYRHESHHIAKGSFRFRNQLRQILGGLTLQIVQECCVHGGGNIPIDRIRREFHHMENG